MADLLKFSFGCPRLPSLLLRLHFTPYKRCHGLFSFCGNSQISPRSCKHVYLRGWQERGGWKWIITRDCLAYSNRHTSATSFTKKFLSHEISTRPFFATLKVRENRYFSFLAAIRAASLLVIAMKNNIAQQIWLSKISCRAFACSLILLPGLSNPS